MMTTKTTTAIHLDLAVILIDGWMDGFTFIFIFVDIHTCVCDIDIDIDTDTEIETDICVVPCAN
jgi:hypothetical protein